MHKQLALDPPSLDGFPLYTMLRAADLTMRSTPRRMLPITPHILKKMCSLCSSLGEFGPAMRVCLTFAYFGMMRQSNLAPYSKLTFDCTRNTCRGDVLVSPPGLVIIMKWAKTIQTMDKAALLPLPSIQGSIADPVQAFHQLEKVSPTTSPNQPLLTVQRRGRACAITTKTLSKLFKIIVKALRLDSEMYSLHSLRRGGATAAFNAGVSITDIKRHGNWSSDAFWIYVTSPAVADSSVAKALASNMVTSQLVVCHK